MAQRILDYNPLTGETVTFEYHHATDSMTIGHHQDIEPILEANKRLYNDVGKQRTRAKEDWAKYASVPNVTILEWRQKYGVDFFDPNHWRGAMKLINDPEYRYVKCTTYKHDR